MGRKSASARFFKSDLNVLSEANPVIGARGAHQIFMPLKSKYETECVFLQFARLGRPTAVLRAVVSAEPVPVRNRRWEPRPATAPAYFKAHE